MVLWQSCLVFVAFISVGRGENFRQAEDEEFPFQVSIKSTDQRHLCGGAIITKNWVLTASSCLEHYPFVTVSYGSADSNMPKGTVRSQRIVHGRRMALIKLESDVQFSKTTSQAKLPTSKAQMQNTTKLSGWKVDQFVDVPPSLFVTDRYLVILKDCRRITGLPVALAIDEFCGINEEGGNDLTNPGSIVSKSAVALGLLHRKPLAPTEPFIFIKISEHEQWIRDVLQEDAQYVNWVNKVPKDSANSQYTVSLTLLGLATIFLRYL